MTHNIISDRIKAHLSAPDVYDPPTFDEMAARIKELEDINEALRSAQSYRYIGKDGKPIMARELKDQLNELAAQVKAQRDEFITTVNLVSKLHNLMRQCGWHLAPASEVGDSETNLALADAEEMTAEFLEKGRI